jgi:hypothetical protein
MSPPKFLTVFHNKLGAKTRKIAALSDRDDSSKIYELQDVVPQKYFQRAARALTLSPDPAKCQRM